MQEWIQPVIQLASLGVICRAAHLLGKIQASMELMAERVDSHDKKIDQVESDIAIVKGKIGWYA